ARQAQLMSAVSRTTALTWAEDFLAALEASRGAAIPSTSDPKGPGAIVLRRERTDVAALLRSSLAPLIAQCRREEIELRVDAETDVRLVFADREKLAWSISALVGNALRYLRRGSRENVGGSILVHLTTQGGDVAVAVQDDGPGIAATEISSLLVRGPGERHA